jgi:TFIIF-interacting CTD phosphatase-like protein
MVSEKKLNVILDLDNTLLSAIPLEEFKWDQETKNKALKFDIHNMEDYYIIFERPKLQKFLNYLFKNFNVSIWSAASKNYVLFIVDNIILTKKNRKLDNIFFSYHCSISKKLFKGGIKKLKLLWKVFQLAGYDKDNTVIVDDLEDVKKIQPKNCIDVHPFEFFDKNSENDDEFTKVIERLEKIKEKLD